MSLKVENMRDIRLIRVETGGANFLCLRPPKVGPEALCFRVVRPSVRPYVRPSRFRSRDNLRTV